MKGIPIRPMSHWAQDWAVGVPLKVIRREIRPKPIVKFGLNKFSSFGKK
jgi:hypothetical protein